MTTETGDRVIVLDDHQDDRGNVAVRGMVGFVVGWQGHRPLVAFEGDPRVTVAIEPRKLRKDVRRR